MKKRAILGILALTIGLVGLPAPTVLVGDFRCTGDAPPVVDNLVVPRGAFCLAFGTHVRGNIKLESGSEGIFGTGLTVRGNLDGDGFQSVSIPGSRIGGNVHLKKGNEVFFDDLFFGGNDAGGNVQLTEIRDEIDLNGGNWIEGNLKLEKNLGSRRIDISNNTVRQDMQVSENTGATVIAGNRVGQNLHCGKNTPPPIGGGNTARKKEGQCAAR